MLRQGLLVLHIAPGLDHAVLHRDPAVSIVIVNLYDWVVRRLRKRSEVHGTLGGVIAVIAVFLQTGSRRIRLLLPMHLRYRLYILPFYLRFFPLWQPHTPFFCD
jgi:hypothetical protein